MFRSQTVHHQEDFLSPTSGIRWIYESLGPCSDYNTDWIFRGSRPGRRKRFSVFAKASGSALEPSSLVFRGYRTLFNRDKVAGACNWSLTSIQCCRGQERVEPYLCSSCIGRIGSWWGNRRGRDRWGDLGVDGWIIFGWIFRRWVAVCGLDWASPG